MSNAGRLTMSNADRPLHERSAAAAFVFVAALLYLLAFADYGFHREDEGALLMQFWLWSTGELPHRDFHLGYTPGVFFVHKTLMQMLGPDLLPGRYLLAFVNSLSAALLFVLARRATSSLPWALVAPLLFVTMVPVYAGEFAAFNIPYPVWYCVLFFAAGAVLLARVLDRPGTLLLLACGVLAGLGFTFKPNVGLFQLAATALVCLLACGRPRTTLERTTWWGWWLATIGGLVVVFANAGSPAAMAWFLAPAVAAAVAVARDAHETPQRAGAPQPLACALLVGAGFLAVCLPWLAWSWQILGSEWFARRALFLGAGFESFYSLPGPAVVLAPLAIAAAATAWLLPGLLSRLGVPVWPLPPIATVLGLAAFGALAATRPMPQGLYDAVMSAAEPRFYTAAALVQWGALAIWLLRPNALRCAERRDGDRRVALVCGIFLYLQLFPRIDLMHWVTAAPLLFPVAAWLLQSLAARWSSGQPDSRRRVVAAAVALPVVALAMMRAGHFLDARWDWTGAAPERTPETSLAIAHAPISINAGRADLFRELEAAVSFIEKSTAPTEPVFTFPALDYVSYFALRKPGNRHGYYFPGWPGHEAEAEVLVALESKPPRLAVTLYENQVYFGSASAYYFLFAGYFESRYRRVERIGPYAFLAPASEEAAAEAEETAGGRGEPVAATPVRPDAVAEALGPVRMRALEAELDSPDAGARGAAARRMREWHVLGDFEPLRRALADADASVRAAAVQAVPRTRSPDVRDALLDGVAARAFTAADSVLAVRASNLACDASCVPKLLALTEGYDPAIAAAARGLLGELPIARWQRDFWWKWKGEGTTAFAEPALSKLRFALEHRNADPEHRILAFAFADRLGLEPCPASLREWAVTTPEQAGPDFTVCTALHHLSRAACPGPWLDASLRWLALDPVVSTRTALREARREPARADAALASLADARAGTASAMALWLCSVTGGAECLAAARRSLADLASEEERIAAAWAWSQLDRDPMGIQALRTLADGDASPQVGETARYGMERAQLRAYDSR
jgi:hypothetical protein